MIMLFFVTAVELASVYVRLERLARGKQSTFFCSEEEKKFYNVDYRYSCDTTFSLSQTVGSSKLKWLERLAKDNRANLFDSDKEERFITLTTGTIVMRLFSQWGVIKFECLSLWPGKACQAQMS